MTYMLWQIQDMAVPLPVSIKKALEFHEKKYGRVPNIVEYSKRHEMPKMDRITMIPINIPKNILLVGIDK